MLRKRRRFSREFKLEALRSLEEGRPLGTVAREFGVPVDRLLAWKRAYAGRPGDKPADVAFAAPRLASTTQTASKENVHILLEVHDSETGEIDAAAFAQALNMPLATLAEILGCDAALLRAGAATCEARERLSDTYRLIVQLRNKLGSLHRARVWLHAPHPGLHLHKGTPLEYLRHQRMRPLAAIINAID